MALVEPETAVEEPQPVTEPAKEDGVSLETRKKIEEKHSSLKKSNYYEILEVEKNATADDIRKSFFRMAKAFHPDRLPANSDMELKKKLEVIFAKTNEAHNVLADPDLRAEYEKASIQKEPAPGGRPEDANIQFQKAKIFIKKKNYDQAAESVRWASRLDPYNADYKAYALWIDILRSEQKGEAGKLEDIKYKLALISKDSPDAFYPLRFLSLVYQKLGDLINYERTLIAAHKVEPKNVEVAREVRLLEMRRSKDLHKRK